VREETVWGFQWRKSSTRCGLHVSSVDVEMGGRWKCHLADTDSKDLETIRDEAWLEVMVAVPAKVILNLSNTNGKILVEKGEALQVGCSVEEAGHPSPKVQLRLNRSSELVPLESGLETVQYFPTLEESGSEFSCVWEQVGPLGQVLYQGKETGPLLEVVMAPYITSNIPSILTYEEGMELRVTFEAKPPPSVEEIKWLPLNNGMVVKMLEELEKPHTFETIVTIFNQTEDFDLELTINNSVGSSKKAVHHFGVLSNYALYSSITKYGSISW